MVSRYNSLIVTVTGASEAAEQLILSKAEMKIVYAHFAASNLIDKSITNFAHTLPVDDGMWMRVYLSQFSHITRIVIYNREDCCKNRIIGLNLFIKSGDEIVNDCGAITRKEDVYAFDCVGNGDMVELSKEGVVDSQNIAEIMVYGYG